MAEIVWTELLRKWPVEAFHHLADVLPEGSDKPWQELCPINKVPVNLWYTNVSAEEVVRIAGKDVMAIWWAQRFSSEQLKMIRKDDTKIMVLMCMDTHVYYVWGTLRTLMQDRNLFCYQQLAFLDMLLGQQTRVVCVMETRPQTLVIPVFCIAVGPRHVDIKSFRGDEHSSYETIGTKECIYMLSKRPAKKKEEIVVPVSVKLSWLRRTFQNAQSQNYLTQEYYMTSMEHYSSWSFDLHQKQVSQLIENLPSDAQLIVPGDGIGVVTRMWKGERPVISGDLVSCAWSEGVLQETFEQTMAHGLKGDYLILSYVLSMMDQRDRQTVEQWPGPVMIIEPRDTMTLRGFTHVGPGVWVRGVEKAYYPVISVTEGPLRTYGVAFSENLLLLPEISYLTENASVLYWKAMRPQGKAVVWGEGESRPLVMATLQEFFFYRKRIKGSSVYLSIIGGFFDGQAEDFLLDAVNKITVRRVYVLRKASKRVRNALMRFVSYYEDYDKFYFCCPALRTFRIHFPGVDSEFNVVDEDVRVPQAMWLGRNSRGYYVEVPGGLLIVPNTQESRCLFRVYTEFLRVRNYVDDISSFEQVWNAKMNSLRKLLAKMQSQGTLFDPGKSPAQWANIDGWDRGWIYSERAYMI